MAPSAQPALAGWRLALWVGVAILAHILVALFGVLNRWLQVKPTPPLPALRLALLVSLLALGSLSCIHAATQLISGALSRKSRGEQGSLPVVKPRLRGQQRDAAEAGAGSKAVARSPRCCRISADGSRSGAAAANAASQHQPLVSGTQPEPGGSESDDEAAVETVGAAASPAGGPAGPLAAWRPRSSSGTAVQRQSGQLGEPLPARPELVLRRGLSRRVRDWGSGRPRLLYCCALAVTTVTFATASTCQIVAPGLVDPSLVQLLNMFTVIGVALFQRLLLHHRLPLVIWPASAVMLGGACMVIVPTIGKGATGGLHDWRGWLGFGLSVLSMLSTVLYFVSLQAFRHLGFTSLQLQYCYLLFCILVLLPLSLGVDGASWTAQFAGWSASSWAVLVVLASVVCVGANYSIQHATWQLGAPSVSIFYGIRLVASIVESQILLQYTIIKSGVQIAGTVITVSAVTAYLWFQWRDSKRKQQQGQAATEQRVKAAPYSAEDSSDEHSDAEVGRGVATADPAKRHHAVDTAAGNMQ